MQTNNTNNTNHTIRVSFTKQEWIAIGIQTKWLNSIKTAGIPPVRLSINELMRRMKSLGWKIELLKDKVHCRFVSPLNDGAVTIGLHNYESKPHTWKTSMNDFLRYSRDLKFAFINPFIIPENFNMLTQRIESGDTAQPEMPPEKTIPFRNLPPDILTNQVIKHEEKWRKPVDIDYNNNTILFEDGELLTLDNPASMITIRQHSSKIYRIIRLGKVIRG